MATHITGGGPLEGIRVLDLTRVLAGPFCTMIMGDLGAEVIKVERPGIGDETRAWGPPFVKTEATYFLSVNRNKKSITVNLKHPRGIHIIKELTKICDVVVENFPPGTMQKLGIDYDVLSQVNPRLIYCSITGFGADGPKKDKTGYDLVVSAVGGLMGITGEEGGGPVKVGVAITDVVTGVFAFGAIVTALYERDRSGKGQRIDTSLLEVQVAALVNAAEAYLGAGYIHRRLGTAHESIVPYQGFKTKDRYIVVAVGNDKIWRDFCVAVGHEELINDPEFCTNPLRVRNRKKLIELLEKMFEQKTADEWISILEKAAVPCGPVNSMDEVFNDPQVLHRNMVVEVEHPVAGNLKMVASPLKYSRTPTSYRYPPPLLGQHTVEILKDLLGYSEEEIQKLREEGVV